MILIEETYHLNNLLNHLGVYSYDDKNLLLINYDFDSNRKFIKNDLFGIYASRIIDSKTYFLRLKTIILENHSYYISNSSSVYSANSLIILLDILIDEKKSKIFKYFYFLDLSTMLKKIESRILRFVHYVKTSAFNKTR